MKTKNKIGLLIISFIAVVATVFLAVPQGISAAGSANDVIRGGFTTKQQFKNKFDQAFYIFDHYGIKKSHIDGLKEGSVKSNGDVFVGNQKVATNARSVGRQSLNCTNKVITVKNGNKFYERNVQCPFVSSSLPALVKLDSDGVFEYAVIKNCANPTIGKPTHKPSVKIKKSVNKNLVSVGEQFTYTMTATNNGSTGLKGVVIKDGAPNQVEFIPSATKDANKGVNINVGKSGFAATIGNLAKGKSTTVHIKAKYTAKAPNGRENMACVSGRSTNGKVQPQEVKACDTAKNATKDIKPSITINKGVNKDKVFVDEQFTYWFRATNNGNAGLNSVIIEDNAPDGVEFISVFPDDTKKEITGAITDNGKKLKINVGKLVKSDKKDKQPGESHQSPLYKVKARFTKSVDKMIVNKVCVSGKHTDTNVKPAKDYKVDNCATAQNTTKPLEVDITKSVDKSQVRIGEEFTYTIVIENKSSVKVDNIDLNDEVKTPEFIELIPGSGTNGLMVKEGNVTAGKEGISLAAGEKQTFTLRAKFKEGVAEGSVSYNQACISALNLESEKCSSAQNEPLSPNPPAATIAKTVSKEEVGIGEVFTYTVKVKNVSETAVRAANLIDVQPEGVEFIVGTATNGASVSKGDPNKDGQEVSWFGKLGFPLAAGEEQVFSVQAKLTSKASDKVVNTACIKAEENINACATAENILMLPAPPQPSPPRVELPPAPQQTAPAVIASTGPVAVAASVVGVSALGYGARQWMISRRAISESISQLYKNKD